jgi:Fungal Zn(2)-Cys(6) binuclear cluster domain
MQPTSNVILSDNKVYKSSTGVPPVARNSLSSRSCITCSRRKVKCDKKSPCYHCAKAKVDCVFPPPGRASRRPRKTNDGNVYERLRRLESFIQDLGIPVQPNGTISVPVDKRTSRFRSESDDFMQEASEEENTLQTDLDGVSDRFGSLIVTEDSSRYISPGLWTHLSDEVYCY